MAHSLYSCNTVKKLERKAAYAKLLRPLIQVNHEMSF